MNFEIPKFRDFRGISIFLGYTNERKHTLSLCQAIRTIFHEPGSEWFVTKMKTAMVLIPLIVLK
jgi:hypothetical protein